MSVSGIYKITSPSGMVYIGQSVEIHRRWGRYKSQQSSLKKQTKLCRSIEKYSVESHEFEILIKCSPKDLNKYERFFQEKYDSVDNGLNCYYTKHKDKSGRASKETLENMSKAQRKYFKNNPHPFTGREHTEETKEKIRQKAIGRKFSDEVNKKKGRKGSIPPLKGKFGKDNPISKPVLQLNKDHSFVKWWDSIQDIYRELGYSQGNISMCCNGKAKTAYGYIWCFPKQ